LVDHLLLLLMEAMTPPPLAHTHGSVGGRR
jgi:hypothetical protein